MRRRSHVTSTIEQYAQQHRCALNGPEQALWDEIPCLSSRCLVSAPSSDRSLHRGLRGSAGPADR
jgi:hypothetical protein